MLSDFEIGLSLSELCVCMLKTIFGHLDRFKEIENKRILDIQLTIKTVL